MNRDEVLNLAKECGFHELDGLLDDDTPSSYYDAWPEEVERFAAAMYAKGAEDMRVRADDAWADALQADCEHGVKFLSENAASELHRSYPELAKLGETIRALPTTNTEGEQ